MPYRICKTLEIESGHLLTKHAGNCRFPHGHSRTIGLVVSTDTLDPNDMVCDFKLLKSHLQELLAAWDHAFCLNTTDPHFETLRRQYGERLIPFVGCDPTSEVMARILFDALRQRLDTTATVGSHRAVQLESVRVSETTSSWAEYSEP